MREGLKRSTNNQLSNLTADNQLNVMIFLSQIHLVHNVYGEVTLVRWIITGCMHTTV